MSQFRLVLTGLHAFLALCALVLTAHQAFTLAALLAFEGGMLPGGAELGELPPPLADARDTAWLLAVLLFLLAISGFVLMMAAALLLSYNAGWKCLVFIGFFELCLFPVLTLLGLFLILYLFNESVKSDFFDRASSQVPAT